MGIITRVTAAAVGAASVIAVMVGCAATPGADSLSAAPVTPPSGEVVGTGTVLDVAGDVQLCLGPVAESYPPQCSGLPLEGWSWSDVAGVEESGDTRWGTYAVFGTFDGEVFAVTQPPIMLALYDPIRPDDPTGGVPGDTAPARLDEISTQLPAVLGDLLLATWTSDGYLWAEVIWDDGTLQEAADADFGDGVVIVQSALKPLG